MQAQCKVLKDNWKRCFSNRNEAYLAASEIPDIKSVYKCPSCHWWHLTSKGSNRLPKWVQHRQDITSKLKEEKKKDRLEKYSKHRKEQIETTLPISVQKEVYKNLAEQKPKRSFIKKMYYFLFK